MKQNWIVEEARKADITQNVAFLEKPDVRARLDEMLTKDFWPVISRCLEQTLYAYTPGEKPEVKSKLGYSMRRSLLFMMFDGMKAFFRGNIVLDADGWMVESELFLGLRQDNDPQVIFELLGNSRFVGNPPSLMIYKYRPEYFQITYSHGYGAGWGYYSEEKIFDSVREVINVNAELYELAEDGYISADDVGEFLTLAYKVYEAY